MSNVIIIELHTDLPTRSQNKFRYSIERGIWLAKKRKAEADEDYSEIMRLNAEYEKIGLP